MTTIYSNKTQFLTINESSIIQTNKTKYLNKLFFASNIFATHYHVIYVHVINGCSILYETLREN